MSNITSYCDFFGEHEALRSAVVVAPWRLSGVDLSDWGDAAGQLYLPLEKESVLWQWRRALRGAGFSVSEVDVGLTGRVELDPLREHLVLGRFSGMYLVSALTVEKFGDVDVFPGRQRKPLVTVEVVMSEASVVAVMAVACVVDMKFAAGVTEGGAVDVVLVRALVSMSCAAWVAGIDAVVTEKRCAWVVASVEAQFVVERSGLRLMERWLCCDCLGEMGPMCDRCADGSTVSE